MIQTKKRSWKCSACPSRNEGTAKKCVCGTRKGTKRGNIGKRCDALWATWIKRDGKCFVCHKTEGIQAAHIIGRAREDLIVKAIGGAPYRDLRVLALLNWDKQYPLEELTRLVKEQSGS